jgi:hypothetical protein
MTNKTYFLAKLRSGPSANIAPMPAIMPLMAAATHCPAGPQDRGLLVLKSGPYSCCCSTRLSLLTDTASHSELLMTNKQEDTLFTHFLARLRSYDEPQIAHA